METTTRTEALFFISKLSTRLTNIASGNIWASEELIEDIETEIANWTRVANAAANN